MCIGGPCSKRDGWENIVSQGNREIDLYVQSRSPRFATIFRVFRTDQGKPKQVHRFQRSGRRVRWDGLVDGKPLAAGVYPDPRRRSTTGQAIGACRPWSSSPAPWTAAPA